MKWEIGEYGTQSARAGRAILEVFWNGARSKAEPAGHKASAHLSISLKKIIPDARDAQIAIENALRKTCLEILKDLEK